MSDEKKETPPSLQRWPSDDELTPVPTMAEPGPPGHKPPSFAEALTTIQSAEQLAALLARAEITSADIANLLLLAKALHNVEGRLTHLEQGKGEADDALANHARALARHDGWWAVVHHGFRWWLATTLKPKDPARSGPTLDVLLEQLRRAVTAIVRKLDRERPRAEG